MDYLFTHSDCQAVKATPKSIPRIKSKPFGRGPKTEQKKLSF